MDIPQPEPLTVERLKEMLVDQMLIIDQQARHIQNLIAALNARPQDEIADKGLAKADGVKPAR